MAFTNASLPFQTFLNEYGNRSRTWNVLDYFMRVSAANTRINLADEQFTKGPGKKRTARITYVPIQCDTDAACGAGLCTTGTVIEPTTRDFDITQCTSSKKYRLEQDSIRYTDNEGWTVNGYAREMFTSVLPEFRRQIALDMLTYAYTKRGLHADGTATKRLPLVTNVNNATPTPVGLWSVEREYLDNGYDMPYILGGGADFYNMRKAIEIGGLDQNGLYINRIPTDNSWYDQGLQKQLFNDVANGDWALSIDPQMFKLVFFHKNVGQFSTDLKGLDNINQLFAGATGPGHDFILSTLTDPVTGLTFDLFVNFDKCDLAWDFHFEVNWDMFVMPDINCGPVGTNGIMVWRTCPEIEVACPTGTPVTPAPAPTVRSWNPAFTYPQGIYQAKVGDREVTFPNGPVALTADADTVKLLNDAFGASIFTLNGSNIQYTGYSNLSVSLNDGAITGAFAGA